MERSRKVSLKLGTCAPSEVSQTMIKLYKKTQNERQETRRRIGKALKDRCTAQSDFLKKVLPTLFEQAEPNVVHINWIEHNELASMQFYQKIYFLVLFIHIHSL